MAIRILINYARSGGTLLAKCLDQLPQTLILSEIHPTYKTGKDLWEQIEMQCGLKLKSKSFTAAMTELHDYCEENSLKLVIRDWTFIDWTPHAINNFDPSKKFSLLNAIPTEIETKVLGFVRDPIDIWISRWFPPLFFEVYEGYAEALKKEGLEILKFEDFCKNSDHTMKKICNVFDLEFHDVYKKFYLSNNIQGDQSDWGWSRSEQREIKLPKRKFLSQNRRRQLSELMAGESLNEVFGYSPDYASREIEESTLQRKVGQNLLYWLEKSRLKRPKERY